MDNYNQNFSNYTVIDSQPAAGSGVVAKKFMASVFLWMFVALGVSALFALLYASNASLFSQLYEQTDKGMRPTTLSWVIRIAPLGLLFLIQMGMNKFSAGSLTFLFIVFAAVLGIGLSDIFIFYSPGSIIGCFASASVMFGVMAVMGYSTDKDLTSFGRIMAMGAIGIFVAMMINMFLHSSGMAYVISIIGVAVFTGLTAYDTQKLKRIGAGLEFDGTSAVNVKKLALMGALSLFLDFLNIFLFLLQLFGNRRN